MNERKKTDIGTGAQMSKYLHHNSPASQDNECLKSCYFALSEVKGMNLSIVVIETQGRGRSWVWQVATGWDCKLRAIYLKMTIHHSNTSVV